MIDGNGAPLPGAGFKSWHPVSGNVLKALLLRDAMIGLPTVMMERSLLKELDGFNEQIPFATDHDLWLRATRLADCGLVDEPLTIVRRHPGNTARGRAEEVDASWIEIYSHFAESSASPEEQRICRRQEALHAVFLGRQWVSRRRWRDAAAAFVHALRLRPLFPWAWKSMAEGLFRSVTPARRGAHPESAQ